MKELLEELARQSDSDANLSEEQIVREWLATLARSSDPEHGQKAQSEHSGELGLVKRALNRASVLATFQIDTLISDLSLKRDIEEAVRSELLRGSSAVAGRRDRILANVLRRERIVDLAQDNQLREVLAETDGFARRDRQGYEIGTDAIEIELRQSILRSVLKTWASDGPTEALKHFKETPDAPMQELQASLHVLNWLPLAEVNDGVSLAQLETIKIAHRQAIAQMEANERLREEAARFVGRQPLLKRIDENLFSSKRSDGVPIYVMFGIGGIGKSAIIAKYLTKVRENRPDVLIGRIDFDRPGFDTAEASRLSTELLRQIAAQARISDPNLVETRDYDLGFSVETAYTTRDLSLDQLAEVRNAAGTDRQMLLVIDTLEERQRQGASSMTHVTQWLQELGWVFGANMLSVLVAGRAEPNANNLFFPPHQAQRIDELDEVESATLLESLGHPSNDATKLAGLTGNPLLLHLLSRLVTGENGPSVAEITDDSVDRSKPPEILQRFVYDRILKHVADDRARDLAYPGLVLREVTPEVVERIMAPIVLGEKIDSVEARKLFEALRREVWLVEEVALDRVRHRNDMRRLMMDYLLGDKDVVDTSNKIHKNAAEYFAEEGNLREADYHRAMTSTAEEVRWLTPRDASQWIDHLGADIDFVKPSVAASLRGRAGYMLSDRELRLLPPSLWLEVTDKMGPEIIAKEDMRRARSILGDVPKIQSKRRWHLEAFLGYGDGYTMDLSQSSVWFDLATDENAPSSSVDLSLVALLGLQSQNYDVTINLSGRAAQLLETLERKSYQKSTAQEETSVELSSIIRLMIYGIIARNQRIPTQSTTDSVPGLNQLRVISRLRLSHLFDTSTPMNLLPEYSVRVIEDIFRLNSLTANHPVWVALDLPPRSRFQFVPAIYWHFEASRIMRNASEEYLSAESWIDIRERLLSAAYSEGEANIRTLTEDMPSEVLSAMRHLPISLRRSPILRGVGFAEHRLSLRFAVSDAIGYQDERLEECRTILYSLCREAGRIIPRELSEPRHGGPKGLESTDHLLVPLLLYADQCGLFPQFAARAANRFPESETLNKIAKDLEHWAMVYDTFFIDT